MNRRYLIKVLANIGLLATLSASRFSYSQSQVDKMQLQCIDIVSLYDQFFVDGKGFEMFQPPKSTNTVFVVFDPQCPDCIQFWKVAGLFKDYVRFIWLPVAVLNSRSEIQGALMLSASNPADLMARQVATFDTSSRGLVTEPAKVSSNFRDDVWRNSRIFRRGGGKSVPFLLYQDPKNQIRGSDQVGTVEMLRKFLQPIL